MAWVYILRGSTERHYIGSCVDLVARFEQHLRGHTATTKRLGPKLEIVASKELPSLPEARRIDRARALELRHAVLFFRRAHRHRPLRARACAALNPCR